MNQSPVSYALTTSDRVKVRLGITNTGTATTLVLDAIIAGVTDLIESECNRRFKRTTYANEVYSVFNAGQKIFALKNIPVTEITSVQYRFGLKSSPNWTEFNTDDWELLEDGKSGLVRIWGIAGGANYGINALRFSYTAGYLIDFSNAGTATTHTLPFDLSDLAERLTIKLYKRREHEGKESESFEGSTVAWKDLYDDIDKNIMNGYKRLPVFI